MKSLFALRKEVFPADAGYRSSTEVPFHALLVLERRNLSWKNIKIIVA